MVCALAALVCRADTKAVRKPMCAKGPVGDRHIHSFFVAKLIKKAPDWQKIAEFAEEYELKSVLREIPEEYQKTNQQAPAIPDEEKAVPEEDNLFSWGEAQKQKARSRAEKSDKPIQDALF